MANLLWAPSQETATQHTATVQITAVDATPANNTFVLTVGGKTVSAVGNTDVNTTASDLATAWNAEAHPYFSTITASVATDTVTLTADVAGPRFVCTSSVTGGGTGTIGAVTTTVTATSKYAFDEGDNWFDIDNFTIGTAPADSDNVYFKNSDVSCLWGLDQNAIDLGNFYVDGTFTGALGLDPFVFTTCADGTSWTYAPDYRQAYLKIDYNEGFIGMNWPGNRAPGSPRILIEGSASIDSTTIFDTAPAWRDGNPSVDIISGDSNAKIYVVKATGGVGIGWVTPAATSLELLSIGALVAQDSTIYVGPNVTFGETNLAGGDLRAFSTPANAAAHQQTGGSAHYYALDDLTNVVIAGGTFYPGNINSGGDEIAKVVLIGSGRMDVRELARSRTITNVDLTYIDKEIRATKAPNVVSGAVIYASGSYQDYVAEMVISNIDQEQEFKI